ncbi:MAG TPA: 3-phosphoshikimate 1-carboxyvinyltransferase, partial [Bacteroidia bacterium]|nr:3-phosphoshikimate 1-carboxyvinyltransferase [Bacteroidia bacterium]
MAYRITKPDRSVEGVVAVPVSKSEAGRIAIINALRGVAQNNDCLATDTVKLQELLFSEEHTLDAQDGGTTARFLMAYCVVRNRAAVITGSPRLRQRPMSCSVDLLRVLGAEISYLEEEGFLPVSVQAAKLKVPDVVQTSAEKTSQHISALMMIAPLFGKDFAIELTDILSSLPYIELTADLMQQVGVNVQMTGNRIQISGSYNNNILSAGGDWSAASYFFETAALADMADITIENLNSLSKQGDKVIAQMVKSFGVDTIVE